MFSSVGAGEKNKPETDSSRVIPSQEVKRQTRQIDTSSVSAIKEDKDGRPERLVGKSG
jgi:hypothetical protein